MAPGVNNTNVRDMFIDDVHAFVTTGINDVPFSDKFHLQNNRSFVTGQFNQYQARPVVGGHFALMALDGASQIGVSPDKNQWEWR